jgi:hypothetical protein
MEVERQNQVSATKTGFALSLDSRIWITQVSTEGTPSSSTRIIPVTLESYFGQVNYDYKDKYLVER